MKKLTLYDILFFLFLFHICINIEKVSLINELFSLFGVLILFRLSINKHFKFDKCSLLVSCFFMYLLIYSLVSYFFLRQGNNYQFIRTLPIMYSIPSFFLGWAFVKYGVFDRSLSFFSSGWLKYPVLFGSIVLGGRLSNPLIFPFLGHSIKNRNLFILICLLGLLVVKGGSTSVIFIFAFLSYIVLTSSRWIDFIFRNKLFFTLLVLVTSWLTVRYSEYYYSNFIYYGWDIFQTDVDVNLIWRFMYWNYVFKNEILLNPVFGIGFGTPLFDMADPSSWFIQAATPEDENLAYTHGVHNSFIFIVVRTGLFGFILFISPIYVLLKNILNKKLYKESKINLLLLSFIFVNISALFNVVIETPLYASIYWIIFGMLTRECNTIKDLN